MSHLERRNMLVRQQRILYAIILITGLFLHLLLWDENFLSRLGRISQGWPAIIAVWDSIWVWIRLYLIRGIGIWLLITALMMLFVVLPMMNRYQYIRVKPNIWLAVNVSVYFFLIMKMLRVY